MSVNIFHKTGSGTGTLQKVAGNTVILDANVSEIRNGNFSLSITSTAGYFRSTVTFATPMPDTDYIVNLEVDTADYLVSNITPLIIDQKTVNGFRINWYGQAGSGVSGVISGKYYAFKPIPMDGYTELQNKVNNPDNMPTQNSDNLVKSGGVFDALKDAGTVFTGTKAQWEALDPTDQERYELVCIIDDEEATTFKIGYIGEEVETTIHEWDDSLQDGSRTEDVTLTEDGWYFIQILLEQSALKENNIFTFSMLGKDNEYHTLIRHSYNQAGTMTVTHMLPLKAGSYKYSHTASSNAVDGRAYAYMNRRDMA